MRAQVVVLKWKIYLEIGLWRSLASALAWGARGPEFKSRQPDQIPQRHTDGRSSQSGVLVSKRDGKPSSCIVGGPIQPYPRPQLVRISCSNSSRLSSPNCESLAETMSRALGLSMQELRAALQRRADGEAATDISSAQRRGPRLTRT